MVSAPGIHRLHPLATTTALLAGVFGLGAWASLYIHEGHNWGGDFALYISQAQALLGGQTDHLFQLNKLTMDRSNLNLGPYLYPHGFPALLAPVVAAAGLSFPLLKAYCLLFLLGALPVMFLLFRTLVRSEGAALVLVLLVGCNYFYLSFADNVLSDFPYLFFSLLSLLLMGKEDGQRVWLALLLGLCLFTAHAIRGVGIVLIPALIIHHALQLRGPEARPRAWLVRILPYGVFLLLRLLQDLVLPDGAENHYQYLDHVTAGSLAANAWYYLKLMGSFVLPLQGMDSPWVLAAAALVLLPCLVGVARGGREALPLMGYLGLFLLVQVAWPVRQGARFLLPVMPLMLLLFWRGLAAIPCRRPALPAWILSALLLLGTVGQSAYITHHVSGRETNQAHTPEMRRIYRFIRDRTPPAALLAFSKPRVARLFTGRNAVRISPAQARAARDVLLVLVKAGSNPLRGSHRVMLRTAHYLLLERNHPGKSPPGFTP